jgi:hypothetical protein
MSQVHTVVDDGASLTELWAPINVTTPSIPLQKPGTDLLYVGDGNGRLLQVDVTGPTPSIKPLQLDLDGVQIGAPSLDNVNSLIHVGSEKGVIYAVKVPF